MSLQSHRRAFAIPIAIFLLSAASVRAQAANQSGEPNASREQKQRTKMAQGEYAIVEQANGGAIGPYGEEIYNFHETWTLWKLGNGGYEVEGERRFESPKGVEHTNRFLAELSRDLTIDRVTEFAPLRWKRDSGPLTCEFLTNALHCSSNAKNLQDRLELKIPMQAPFGLLWPVSAFSLSGITREAERNLRGATPIQLVSIEQPNADMPVNAMTLDGNLRYVGEEKINAGGQIRSAFKFSIKVALSPELVIWTTPKGVLLEIAVQHEGKQWPEESLKLLQFQERAGFD